ncbi:MAG TPA: sporangiospore maturation cell wall hydrolase GsmA [Pilimelia sp.]|nr:sporangiospore maturation cell wall hydrolase GsmA [Pilimelia sp.]
MRGLRELLVVLVLLAAPVAVPAPASAQAAVTATVRTTGGPLTMRTGPATITAAAGTLANGQRLTVQCQVYGERVRGPVRLTGYWDRLANGRFISDAYVSWSPARPAVRWCGAGGAPVVPYVASPGGPVNLRAGPGVAHRRTGRLATGTALTVLCMKWGDRVTGRASASHAWDLLSSGHHIADALVAWRPSRPTLPYCGQFPPTVPAATQAGFVARVAGSARLSYRAYRVPASVTIAQAILESGWGRSGLTRRDHNYFGIKCFGTPGPIAVGCRAYGTSECGGGRCWRTVAQFRAYRNAAGSMADHGRFLAVNPRYRPAFRYTRDPDRFAIAIHRAGYATSPTYATNLVRLMRRYDLYRYDR